MPSRGAFASGERPGSAWSPAFILAESGNILTLFRSCVSNILKEKDPERNSLCAESLVECRRILEVWGKSRQKFEVSPDTVHRK